MGSFSIKYGGRTVFFQNSSVFERILRGCGILVVCGRILKVLGTILYGFEVFFRYYRKNEWCSAKILLDVFWANLFLHFFYFFAIV